LIILSLLIKPKLSFFGGEGQNWGLNTGPQIWQADALSH
jgi:hypothetical protein